MCVQWLQRPKEGIESPGAGVPGDCKKSDMDVGSWTQVSWKSSTHTYPKCIFSPSDVGQVSMEPREPAWNKSEAEF